MDPQITSIQPGGGKVMRMELAWGSVRRWMLKTFRPQYVKRMARSRRGEANQCPHEVIDPRDLKYFRNQPGYWWEPEDDPFTGRDNLPFARAGLAELVVFSLMTFGGAGLLVGLMRSREWETGPFILGSLAIAALLIVGTLIVWFFRNPTRRIPAVSGAIVSPADGKVVTVERIAHDEFVDGPAILVGIFLSIFNVHINRSPYPSRVIGLTYRPGKFLNALKPESA
ncbi:MAG: phosphatidylserine decarboxylase, partial [Planctomycetaceae bacterium]|nr:phosphatidylserine decarboxylase [Planctomycetaceae bacterium]